MKKIVLIILTITAIIQTGCQKEGYYTENENSMISLICDITWVSKKTINNTGTAYHSEYKFEKNGTYLRTSVATDENGIEQHSDFKGQWSFYDPGFYVINFGYNRYWDIAELTEKKFTVYDRSGEIGELGMTREYCEFTPKE